MEQPKNGVHGFPVAIGALENLTGPALLGGGGMHTGLQTVLDIADLQPARHFKGLTMPRTVNITASRRGPTVDILTTLAQLDYRRLQLIQHFPAFQEEFIDDFSLFGHQIHTHRCPFDLVVHMPPVAAQRAVHAAPARFFVNSARNRPGREINDVPAIRARRRPPHQAHNHPSSQWTNATVRLSLQPISIFKPHPDP
jgi:hypothetical protein